MNNLIRLIYISTTTNPVDPSKKGVQTDIGRILMQSRRNNPRKNVGGVLYFRNNYFLQCLEGEDQAVKEIYNRISTDPRHNKVRVVSVKRVDRRLFSDWSMKYVANEENITRLLKLNGYRDFLPYEFNEEMLEHLLGLFVISKDPTLDMSTSTNSRSSKKAQPGFFARLLGRLHTTA